MEDRLDWDPMEYDSDIEEGRRTSTVGSVAYCTEQPLLPNDVFGSSYCEIDDGSHYLEVCIIVLLFVVCGQTCIGFLLALYMLVAGRDGVESNTRVCS